MPGVVSLALLLIVAPARFVPDVEDRAAPPAPVRHEKPRRERGMAEESQPGAGVTGLPYSQGRSFLTLDDYLAHLQRLGAIDLPWWRRIGPDRYELVAHIVPGGAPERATRAELMRRYGFSR